MKIRRRRRWRDREIIQWTLIRMVFPVGDLSAAKLRSFKEVC